MLTTDHAAPAPTTGRIWIDLCEPDAATLARVEAETGLAMPSRASLDEIENSSRLRERNGVLAVSIPIVHRANGGPVHLTPIGFVFSQTRLVTLHYAGIKAIETVADRHGASDTTSPLHLFTEICEEIVDILADKLEAAAAEMRTLSSQTFHERGDDGRQATRSNRMIRAKLRHIGRLADGIAETRDILLGVGRAVDFVAERTRDWGDAELAARLTSLASDVTSLEEYEVHLADKTQFLLDAMVGLIGIAQNEIFKVLTIVSLAGIPPTLIAGIYGMNFKNMPEYNWAWGYPYGLAVIALSGILPIAWFKWRGWF